jgi:hypothetical protein
MPDPLASQILNPGNGVASRPIMVGRMTAWNATTWENTITVGSAQFLNSQCVDPVSFATYALPSRCLVAMTDAGPVILGLMRGVGGVV